MKQKLIWRVTIRSISECETKPQSMLCVLFASGKREAMDELKTNKFTPAWWDGCFVLDLEWLGEVWHEQEKPR